MLRFDEIKAVAHAEETAEKMRTDAIMQARRIINDAHEQGKAFVTQEAAAAATANAAALEQAKQLGEQDAVEIMASGQYEIKTMIGAAEQKMDKAVAMIIERIVNG